MVHKYTREEREREREWRRERFSGGWGFASTGTWFFQHLRNQKL